MILFAVQTISFVPCSVPIKNVPFIELLLALNIWLWFVHVFWFSCPVCRLEKEVILLG